MEFLVEFEVGAAIAAALMVRSAVIKRLLAARVRASRDWRNQR
jgi:hypothetical protein